MRVGTVDKFQGQEALVAIYSMASSSGEDVPRGLEFLLSRNRLNVAISRAQCLAYLVCSPSCSRSTAARSTRCASPTRSAASSRWPRRSDGRAQAMRTIVISEAAGKLFEIPAVLTTLMAVPAARLHDPREPDRARGLGTHSQAIHLELIFV